MSTHKAHKTAYKFVSVRALQFYPIYLISFRSAQWHGMCSYLDIMKTKKQARIDQLNGSAFNWQRHLDKHYSETRLTKSQVQLYTDKASAALAALNPSKLTIEQIKAVLDLMASAANCAYTCGIEQGKAFEKSKGN